METTSTQGSKESGRLTGVISLPNSALTLRLLTFSFLILFACNVQGQYEKAYYGINVGKIKTGIGASNITMVSATVQKELVSFSAGTNISDVGKLSGGNMDLKIYPQIKTPGMQTFFHVTTLFNRNHVLNAPHELAVLVSYAEMTDKRTNSAEGYFGFGFESKLFKKLYIQNSVGIGFFDVLFSNNKAIGGTSLMLKTAIAFKDKKEGKRINTVTFAKNSSGRKITPVTEKTKVSSDPVRSLVAEKNKL
jgi:hypothetical protein